MKQRGVWFAGIAIAAALVLVYLPVSGTVNSASPGGIRISYNPAPADGFHAPLSSIGLVGVTGAHPSGIPGYQPAGLTFASSSGMQSLPVNATRYIVDGSYIPQSETTLDVGTSGTQTVILGGVNDARFFFCGALPATDCPTGWTFSLSGFTVGNESGGTVSGLASNDLPGILYRSTVNPNFIGFLVSFGDPSIAFNPENGQFFYASLAIDPFTGNNGIQLSVSNAQLWSNPNSCITSQASPWTNPCWSSTFVFGALSGFLNGHTASHVPNTFEDKELIAVDRDVSSSFYGSVYVSWDHFFASGTSGTYMARCSTSLSCTMISGGGNPLVSGTSPFTAFSTPAVGSDGRVYLTWCNYGTATTLGPITCFERSSGAGGTSWGTINTIVEFDGGTGPFAALGGLSGYATEQFRTVDIPSLAVDASGGTHNGTLYFAIDVCSAGNYYAFANPAVPGDCGLSSILYATSTNTGSSWSASVISPTGVNAQPYVTVDQTNGNVVVVYYTTSFDAFNHRIDVLANVSTNGGTSFSSVRVTNISDEPDSDPAYYDWQIPGGFGGSFIVPQFGDYFQAVATGGTMWVLFTGDYAVELGTFQADPWLASAAE